MSRKKLFEERPRENITWFKKSKNEIHHIFKTTWWYLWQKRYKVHYFRVEQTRLKAQSLENFLTKNFVKFSIMTGYSCQIIFKQIFDGKISKFWCQKKKKRNFDVKKSLRKKGHIYYTNFSCLKFQIEVCKLTRFLWNFFHYQVLGAKYKV